MNEKFEYDRMDDDGGPPADIRIGIATAPEPAIGETAILSGGRLGKTFPPDGETTGASWARFEAWRRTKCRPYDCASDAHLASKVGDIEYAGPRQDRAVEEIDQATHEFVGECAELVELIVLGGLDSFADEAIRGKLIDEAGDCFFCGCWVLDAWGVSPSSNLRQDAGVRLQDDSELADELKLRRLILATRDQDDGDIVEAVALRMAATNVLALTSQLMSCAGLLCNSFKKLRYQRRPQDATFQAARVIAAMFVVERLLAIAGSSVEEALDANVRKLDARYPEGYKSGVGGGIREGVGR